MASVDRKWIAPALIAAAFAASAIAYPRLPLSVTLPVDALLPFAGPAELEPGPRWVLAFLIPSLALVLWLGFRFALTERGQHVGRWFFRNAPAEVTSAGQFARFARTYETILLGVVTLILAVHAGLLAAAFQRATMGARIIGVTLALFLVIVGNVMPRVRPNWVAGLRAKRLLADPDLWRTTHRAFGAALVGSGILTLGVALGAPRYSLVTGMALFLVSGVVAFVTTMSRSATKPSAIVLGLAVVLGVGSIQGQATAPPIQIVSEEVTFVAGGRTIPGTLVHPASGTGPGVLLLAGSGPTDRDWNSPLLPGTNGSGRLLAEALAARGVTVLRFDKAFSGRNPNLPIADLTIDTFRDEASAALDFLRSRAEVDPARVFVAGHSEGGIHATRLAELRGDQIRGVILISAPGRSLREVLEVQLEKNVLGAITMTPEQVEAEMVPIRTALRSFVAGQDVDPKSASSRPEIVGILTALMAPSVARIGRALVSFEPAQAAAGLAGPVLVLQGGKDVQVDPVENAERLVAARRAERKPVDYHLSPLADHTLKTEPRPFEELRANIQQLQAGYNAPDRTLAADLVEALARWIRDT